MRKTGIDYLRFRAKNNPFEVLEAVREFFNAGHLLHLGPAEKGKDGWDYRHSVDIADITIAYIDYGGESQRTGSDSTCQERDAIGFKIGKAFQRSMNPCLLLNYAVLTLH